MCFSKKIENGIIFGNPKNRFTSIRIRETAMAVPLLRCSSFDDDWRSKDGRVRQTAKLGSNFNRTTMIKSSCCCYSRFASKMCRNRTTDRPSEQLNDDIPLLRFSFSPISFFLSFAAVEWTNERNRRFPRTNFSGTKTDLPWTNCFVFLKMGHSWPLFSLFSSFVFVG